MIRAAIAFFVLALVSAFFGFSGMAAGAAWMAKVMILVFVVLAAISLLVGRRPAVS
ncbi:MAG: DUF1328 domain-containing protein [Myxococcales bacterium]|nr:DUF1328 domain-containing protein [Myxococcales bacterium]